jgi:U4/U6.U5 tri-snRNP-associated protein 1
MSSSKKRQHIESEEEDDVKLSSGGEEIHRRKSSKKSKKHKKEKKRNKSKRRRHRSGTPEEQEVARSTDQEGGSTPEIEAGEVLEISDEDIRDRSRSTSIRNERSRSASKIKSVSPTPALPPPPEAKSPKSPPTQRKLEIKRKLKRSPSPEDNPAVAYRDGGAVESLSINETNKLRASLGLPPLRDNKAPVKNENEGGPEVDDGKEGKAIPNSEVRHKPAINLKEKSQTEQMREKLNQRRLKRQQEAKLMSVSTLGASDDVDDTSKWLQRQKKKAKERKQADRRAKVLAEMDDEFGVGNIVNEDTIKDKAKQYGSQSLAGMKVEHSANKFLDGKTVILTLKDADILDEDLKDTLVNVNMIDDERVDKNKDNIKKVKAGGYNPYDQETIDEVTGELVSKNMLDKYDEEIEGETKKSFEIGKAGTYSEEKENELARARVREKLASKITETLVMPQLRVASDYYTEEEVVMFKKPKKKKRVKRKMLKADDLLDLSSDKGQKYVNKKQPDGTRGSIPMDVDEDDVKPIIDDEDFGSIKVDLDDDLDLQRALRKTRRLKQRKQIDEEIRAKHEQHDLKMKEELEDENESTGAEFINTFADDKTINPNLILNETSEFCRQLGAWRSHEGTGLGESVSSDILDFEKSLTSSSSRRQVKSDDDDDNDDDDDDDDDDDEDDGDDMDLDDDDEDVQRDFRRNSGPSSSKHQTSSVILDEEPNLISGMSAAIKLATNKGYWEVDEAAATGSNLDHLQSKNYTIDDKVGQHDDRHSRRNNDRYGGPTSTFQEKAGYVPNVNLEYIDDNGRMLNQKEAFRYLSHRFHGKGSGKIKTEKRMKKAMEENMMKTMSSTDTPLHTLEKLRERQKEAATPYVILSGNKVQATDLKK